MGAVVGPIVDGHLTDLIGSFRWSFGMVALTALLAMLIIGLLRRPRAFIKKGED